MKKETWHILGAVVAVVILALLISVTGCEREIPLEVGQVWEYEKPNDPFEIQRLRRRVLDLQDGYVKYRYWTTDRVEDVHETLRTDTMSEDSFRCLGTLIAIEQPDTANSVNDHEVLDGEIKFETDGPKFSVGSATDTSTIQVLDEGDSLWFTVEAGQPKAGHLRWVWDKEEQDEGHLELVSGEKWISLDDLRSEPNEPPVWGNGELPVEHIKFFGTSNSARLDYVQNQAISKHGLIIVEIAKRILALEDTDPNEVVNDNG